MTAIFETLVRKMNDESGVTSSEAPSSGNKGHDSDDDHKAGGDDKPSTKEESSKGGGCKCSIQ